MARSPGAIRFEINIVDIGAGFAYKRLTALGRQPRTKETSHGTEGNEEIEQGAEEGQKIQPVKNLRLAVRKAGSTQSVEF
jgi:hypothetical protein